MPNPLTYQDFEIDVYFLLSGEVRGLYRNSRGKAAAGQGLSAGSPPICSLPTVGRAGVELVGHTLSV